ncbi:ferrichrome transport system permease protein FhuG [Clostridium botulinum B str. Osaka05]|uniref:Ferrichrome transport system permease protein FhuG n=1 Tax=Clostridium botulinum B str. Osaka05 TaxID=1407017 RepID=A0A060N5X6_CLOBO|nr:hypothetical protein [Clostridium botulinum]BAO04955.1 ferrichrome transport system permease protein FhuG [Clostridium botulinum B str. Osaka05]
MKNEKLKIKLIKQYEEELIKQRDFYINDKDRDALVETNIELRAIERIKDILGID